MRALGRWAAVLAWACVAVGARAETITVTHYGSGMYGAPYAVALEKGMFKEHGVDITGFLTSAGGGTSVRNTLASDIPFGEVALSAAIEAINAGQPLKIICGGSDSVGDIFWIARPGSPMKSVRDIEGKRIGFTSPGSVSNMLILMAMRAANVDPSKVKLVAAGDVGANMSAVLNGAVDAAMTSEPVWSQNAGKAQIVFRSSDVLPPNMMQTVGVTTIDYAREHGDVLRAIIAARAEGVRYIAAHPEESADIVARAYHGDPELYRTVVARMLALHYWSDGAFDVDGMDRMVEGLRIVGKMSGPMNWSSVIDAGFLPPGPKTN